jgi:hypothetical protein
VGGPHQRSSWRGSAHSCQTRSGEASNSASRVRSTPAGSCGRRSRSSVSLLGAVFDELGHAVDAAAPQLLIVVEQATRDAQPLEVGADDLASPDALLGDQAGPLEDGDVLLVPLLRSSSGVAGQLGDALLAFDRAAHGVAAGVVRQRAEHAIEVGRSDPHKYNHTIVLLGVKPRTSAFGIRSSTSGTRDDVRRVARGHDRIRALVRRAA